MSGKQMPEHWGRNAASLCANQLSTSSTLTPSLYASKWAGRPGFLDPFEVVFRCVRRLRQATFINVRYVRRCDERVADKSHLCPGLEVYFRELRQDPEVQRDLAEYISLGSQSHLKYTLGKYRLDQVLVFLLKYLRERGYLLRIQYSSLQCLQQSCSRSNTLAIAFLSSGYQHEFEYESVVAIGSYLSYLLTVACAHDLFWMQGFLAQLWGPLLVDFVNIGNQPSENMTGEQLAERRVCFMSRLLESMPWETLRQRESLRLTLGPEQDQPEMLRHGIETDRQVAHMLERPQSPGVTLVATAGDICAFLDGRLPESANRNSQQYGEAENDEALVRDEQAHQDVDERLRSSNLENSNQYVCAGQQESMLAPQGICQGGV